MRGPLFVLFGKQYNQIKNKTWRNELLIKISTPCMKGFTAAGRKRIC